MPVIFKTKIVKRLFLTVSSFLNVINCMTPDVEASFNNFNIENKHLQHNGQIRELSNAEELKEKDWLRLINQFNKCDEQAQSIILKHGVTIPNSLIPKIDLSKIDDWKNLFLTNPTISYITFKQYRFQTSTLPLSLEELKQYIENNPKSNQNSYLLFICYFYGLGVNVDEAKAFNYLVESAEQGFACSQNKLGWCLAKGNGVGKDLKESFELFKKAAAQGYPDAFRSLGQQHSDESSDYYDIQKAIQWYEKGAQEGDPFNQHFWAYCHENAEIINQDLVTAFKWYSKAAEQDYHDAQYNMGRCYEFGIGTLKDFDKALEWYSKAAEQNDSRAKKKIDDFQCEKEIFS